MTREEKINGIKTIIQNNSFFGESSISPDELAGKIIDFLDDQKFTPPTLEDCQKYIIENNVNNGVINLSQINEIATEFVNYYSSIDWKVGKSKKQMISWKKALNNWCTRSQKFKASKQQESKVSEMIKAHVKIQNSLK